MIGRLERSPSSLRWLAVAAVFIMGVGTWVLARQPAAAATHAVRAAGFAFSPANLTVAVGDTVTWTNGDAESHAVDGGPLSSPEIRAGESWSTTLTTPGTYSYHCRFHTYMTGTVTVGSGAPPTTAAPPPTAPPTTAPPTTAPPTTAGPTTTAPAAPTSTTQPVNAPPATAPPGGTGSAAFQDVPDDPAARTPPGNGGGDSVVVDPPPVTAPPTTAAPGPTPGFQQVPSDPDGTHPPGELVANPVNDVPTTSGPTTTVAPGPTPAFQTVPEDSSGQHPPGEAVATTVASAPAADPPPATGDPPAAAPPTSLVAAPVPTDVGTPLGDGTVLAPYDLVDGVKEFHLTMAETTIEVAPGDVRQAYAFNGVVPGPVLRVDEGDRVRIVVDNQLPFPTSTHWHGMILPNDQDGVGGITQPHIEPGQQYVYEWTAVATGTHWYHAHSSGRHIGKGLYGVLEVVPRSGDIESDRDYRLMLGDTDLGFTLNGRSFPSTPVLAAEVGETVRLRLVNTGDQVHAIHLHGVPFSVVAQDGIVRRQPESMDTLTIAPGQTFDLLFSQEYPGSWLIHCHMFVHSHMDGDEHAPDESGMNGMTALFEVGPGAGSASASASSSSAGAADVFDGGNGLGPGELAQFGGLAAAASFLYLRRRRLAISPPLLLPNAPKGPQS